MTETLVEMGSTVPKTRRNGANLARHKIVPNTCKIHSQTLGMGSLGNRPAYVSVKSNLNGWGGNHRDGATGLTLGEKEGRQAKGEGQAE